MGVSDAVMGVLVNVFRSSSNPSRMGMIVRSIVELLTSKQVRLTRSSANLRLGLLVDFATILAASRSVVMDVTVPGETPDQEADTGENKQHTDYVALLRFNLALEPEANDGDDSPKSDRGQNVSTSSKKADTSQSK